MDKLNSPEFCVRSVRWEGRGKKMVCTQKKDLLSLSLSYLEVEDDRPNEAECELGVAVHNVLASDVDQLDLLVPGRGMLFSTSFLDTILT